MGGTQVRTHLVENQYDSFAQLFCYEVEQGRREVEGLAGWTRGASLVTNQHLTPSTLVHG